MKPELQEIDAETQIFTPKWVGTFLAENSIGRLWMNSHPESSLVDNMSRYVVSDNPEELAKVDSPEEIRVLDPACGTGNLLSVAFDMLYEIYLDARYKPRDIPGLILSKNLFGVDIDPAAVEAAKAVLTVKALERHDHFFRCGIEPNVQTLTDEVSPDAGLFGTLLRDIDQTRYDVIIGNPPYMGRQHFTPKLKAFARQEYPDSCADLCAMFIERAHEMTVPGGMVAMITMQSWMFLNSFETLRKKLADKTVTLTMAHLGYGVFGSGAVISTTAFVQATLSDPKLPGVYFRLVDSKNKQRDLQLSILNYRGSRQVMVA
jgi:type I restriction-modification system DNA methylase subunit